VRAAGRRTRDRSRAGRQRHRRPAAVPVVCDDKREDPLALADGDVGQLAVADVAGHAVPLHVVAPVAVQVLVDVALLTLAAPAPAARAEAPRITGCWDGSSGAPTPRAQAAKRWRIRTRKTPNQHGPAWVRAIHRMQAVPWQACDVTMLRYTPIPGRTRRSNPCMAALGASRAYCSQSPCPRRWRAAA